MYFDQWYSRKVIIPFHSYTHPTKHLFPPQNLPFPITLTRSLFATNVSIIYFIYSGISLHTFHGNFFVRSTDLLSLPNINPDAGFGMQMSIEDTIETNYFSFQAALLYTSSKGK